MATKEMERKALEKIRKIVADLGEDSYIGKAFEGCFEIAETNIDDDFWCSMKQRAEEAEKKAGMYHETALELAETVEKLRSKVLGEALLEDTLKVMREAVARKTQEAAGAAEQIVEMADYPESQAFRDAVREHRRAKKDAEEYKGICEEIRKVI